MRHLAPCLRMGLQTKDLTPTHRRMTRVCVCGGQEWASLMRFPADFIWL